MPAIEIDFLGFFVNGVFTILFSFDLMESCFQLCERAFCSRLTLCEQDQVELWGERLMDWARVKACRSHQTVSTLIFTRSKATKRNVDRKKCCPKSCGPE